MPAPLDHADHDGTTTHYLALCDPPTGGPKVYTVGLLGPPLPSWVGVSPTMVSASNRVTPEANAVPWVVVHVSRA